MRTNEDRSEREKVDYTELNKTVKRSVDKDHKRNKQIMFKLYFKVVEDQNIYIQRRTKEGNI